MGEGVAGWRDAELLQGGAEVVEVDAAAGADAVVPEPATIHFKG